MNINPGLKNVRYGVIVALALLALTILFGGSVQNLFALQELDNLKDIKVPQNPDSLFDQLRTYKDYVYVLASLFFLFTLVSEDAACVAAGLAISSSITTWTVALAGCSLGAIIGDTVMFLFGYFVGRPVISWWPFNKFLSAGQLDIAGKWFAQNEIMVIILSRFTPGLRGPVYISAGILKMSFIKFLAIHSISVLIWAPLLIGLALIVGYPIMGWIETWEYWSILFLLPVIVFIVYLSRMITKLFTQTGRRNMYKKYYRLKQRFFD